MTTDQLESLKADFLQWTGGFEPETDKDIAAYISTSMPFDLDEDDTRRALEQWMGKPESHPIGRDTDQR